MRFVKVLFATLLLAAAALTPASADTSDSITSTQSLTITAGTTRLAGNAMRTRHSRTVHYTETFLRERRYLQTPTVVHTRRFSGWVPYRTASSYYYGARLQYIGSGLYTLRPNYRYDYSCRFVADCPCRFLAGC